MLKRRRVALAVIWILNFILLTSLVTVHAAQDESALSATQPQESTAAQEVFAGLENGTAPSASEEATTVQPTTYVEPLDFPSLSVSAISNFFGKANADYNQYTKEVTVTYYLKASQGVLTTQWSLSYDPKVLKLDPEKNTPQSICPVVGDKGVVSFNGKKGTVHYNATSVDLFYFKTDDSPYVQLVFDVADIEADEPQITKIDLTVDMLWLSDAKTQTYVVSNYNVADLTKLNVSIGKRTALTESNYVEPTTAEPATSTAPADNTPDEQSTTADSETGSTSADATSATENPSLSPREKPEATQPQPSKPAKKDKPQSADNAVIDTGSPVPAVLLLIVFIAGMVTLLILRKKAILKIMLED